MTNTDENLKAALPAKSQANRLYLASAQKAEEEAFIQAAKLFKAAAEAETIHALNHVRITGQVKSTIDNLGTAISGESYEFKKMYPEFLAAARDENNKQATWSFDVASKVEQVHANLFQKTINALKNKKALENIDYYVCGVCGNTVEGTPPDKCPICGSPKEKFFKPA